MAELQRSRSWDFLPGRPWSEECSSLVSDSVIVGPSAPLQMICCGLSLVAVATCSWDSRSVDREMFLVEVFAGPFQPLAMDG